MLIEILATKAVVAIVEKALAPIANEHKALSIAHRVIAGVNQVSVKDITDVVSGVRRVRSRKLTK